MILIENVDRIKEKTDYLVWRYTSNFSSICTPSFTLQTTNIEMDSKVLHSQVIENDEQQQQVESPGAEEHNTEQDSKSTGFMKNVKAKAKKIGNTIKNIGHHEDAPITPIYDTEAVKTATPAPEKVNNLLVSEADFGGEDRHHHDPTGKGSDEIDDITKVDESFRNLNVQDEEPKTLPTFTETEYPLAGRNDQFDQQTKTQYESVKEGTFNNVTNTAEKQPSYESVETQPKHNHETESLSETASETFSPQNDEASKLAHDVKETHDDYEKVMLELKEEVPETSTGVDVVAKNEDKDHAKGVPVKDYLAEKLRPGEEDKALSEVITETLHKKKEDGDQLATGDEKSEKVSEEPGKGYVEKVKGAVGSWFYTSEEKQSPQVAGDEDLLKSKDSVVEGERVKDE